jgi:hypothetical protein
MSWADHVELIVEFGIASETQAGTIARWDVSVWDGTDVWSGIEPDWWELDPCVIQDVSVTRGRDRWIDRFGASSLSISAADADGRLSWDT